MALRWGLLSTARINGAIIQAAEASHEAEIVAVASREDEKARAYAAEHGIPRAHGSYEALLEDPEVDAVYVSLPNALHVPWAVRALEAGKHVLCEKPLDRRPAEVERAFGVAARAGRVLSEGFMWRHHPQASTLVEAIGAGGIGPVRTIRATFGFTLRREGDVRLDPALDGGSLMDVGCYCVSGARLATGAEPVSVRAEQVLAPTGVDIRMAAVLRFPGDVLAEIDCGFDVAPNHRLEVVGEEGALVLADPWHGRHPRVDLRRPGAPDERLDAGSADPYRCQLEDFAAAVQAGREPRLGRADAVGQAKVIEALYASAAGGETVALGGDGV